MKKNILLFLILCVITILTSCTTNGNVIHLKKDIVLGKQVSSVEYVDFDQNTIIIDENWDFDNLLTELKCNFRIYQKNKLVSLSGTTQRSEKKYKIKMNFYQNNEYVQFVEGESRTGINSSIFEMQRYVKGDTIYENYQYENLKCFGGKDYEEVKYYFNSNYPKLMDRNCELHPIYADAYDCEYILINVPLFYNGHSTVIIGNETYDFSNEIVRKYTMYENYIVLEQTAPFFILGSYAVKEEEILEYAEKYSVKQTAYYNLETKMVDWVKIKGNFSLDTNDLGICEHIFDIEFFVHDLDEVEFFNKIEELKNYIKENSNS